MLKKLLIISAITLTITGCGSSDSSENNNDFTEVTEVAEELTTPVVLATYTGMFLDSAVEGLNYVTASQNSQTNANGEFIFALNEEVTFSIGDIILPTVSATSYLTPLDIFSTDDINQTAVVNLLRLLQSLDVDGDASNNIQISAQSHQAATGINIDFSASDFEQQVADLVANSGALNQQLISADMAITHFQETLDSLNNQTITMCSSDHAKVGYSGTFSTLAHNVAGKATIIDDCTIEITQFSYDGGGPAVYFYGANNHDYAGEQAFALGSLLSGTSYDNGSFIITLPNGNSLDDLTGLSVWCVDFDADFGHMEFTP